MAEELEQRLTRLEEGLAALQEAFSLLSETRAVPPPVARPARTPHYPTPATYDALYGSSETWDDVYPKSAGAPVVPPQRSWWQRLFLRETTP